VIGDALTGDGAEAGGDEGVLAVSLQLSDVAELGGVGGDAFTMFGDDGWFRSRISEKKHGIRVGALPTLRFF
jgi:hypothetical protein